MSIVPETEGSTLDAGAGPTAEDPDAAPSSIAVARLRIAPQIVVFDDEGVAKLPCSRDVGTPRKQLSAAEMLTFPAGKLGSIDIQREDRRFRRDGIVRRNRHTDFDLVHTVLKSARAGDDCLL